MLDVLSSTKPVFENLTEVKIVEEQIDQLAKKINEEELKTPEINYTRYHWDLENLVRLIFLFNTINFCYWAKKGKLKWTVEIGGEKQDGATGLFFCLENKAKKNPDLLKGNCLTRLSLNDLSQILKGNTEIPLLKERLACLNEAGNILEKKFNGDFLNLYQNSDNDALKMVELVVDNFSSFNDILKYNEQVVSFYKRAQLNSKMISDALVSFDKKPLDNLDKLTAFADYKVPQILRKLGILEYSQNLSQKIDNYEIIPAHSKDEIEIRVATIWAVEKIKDKLKPKFPFVTSPYVDGMLWNFGQVKTPDDKPYHRTYTIAY